MRATVLELIQRLRADGVAISVAESLDAMAALQAAGVEREVLREALAATLIKQEEHRPLFDVNFAALFAAPPLPGAQRERGRRSAGGAPDGGVGRGGSSGAATSIGPALRRASEPLPEPRPATAGSRAAPREAERQSRTNAPSETRDSDAKQRQQARDPAHAKNASRGISRSASVRGGDRASTPPLPRRPFVEIDPDSRDAALAAARELGRRFVARTSRRERRRKRGRIDIRRTIRAAISRGGVPLDLHRRGRRPGRPRLIALCDVSGSVALAADLLLSLLAAAEGAFAEVRRYAFVDHLVEVDFVDTHLAPAAPIDLWARSDHGRVLQELEERDGQRLDRHTVLLVLGDARSNRLPARADVLRRLAHAARAVIWVVPEPRWRWNTGDSALAAYAPHCDLVLEALDLASLARSVQAAAQA